MIRYENEHKTRSQRIFLRWPLGIHLKLITLIFSTLLSILLFHNPSQAGCSYSSTSKNLCAGIRGNGNRLFAHFGVLAQTAEHYGKLDAVAGGSSGSITAFLAESIQMNPLIYLCGSRMCQPEEIEARIALQWKSLQAIPQSGLGLDVTILSEIIERIQTEGVVTLLDGKTPQAGVDALISILEDVGPLLNREVIQLLLNSPDPVFHARDIISGLDDTLAFRLDNPLVFIRPGILDFKQVARLLGRVGSFYAAYGRYSWRQASRFLNQCAMRGDGLNWDQVSNLPVGNSTCGQMLINLYDRYRDHFDLERSRSRINDPIGRYLPVLVTTAVLEGDAIAAWHSAREHYLAAQPVDFRVDFSDVGFGYFGQPRVLTQVETHLRDQFDDEASRRFTRLGSTTWLTALSTSPAEPGLARAIALSDGRLSVGGWNDPLRVLVLDAMGCQNTVAVNRPGGVGEFEIAAARLLSASDADIAALTGLRNSSFSLSLAEAEGVWCADWDSPDSFDLSALFSSGYDAPLLSELPYFLDGDDAYENAVSGVNILGCTAELE